MSSTLIPDEVIVNDQEDIAPIRCRITPLVFTIL